MIRRYTGSPTLFAVVYTVIAAGIYFSLGAVGEHAFALTPVVYVAGGAFFVLAALTFVEGASLHQERGGATVFARHAFNELWSFVAGWALLLDYVILLATAVVAATSYLGAYWGEFGHGGVQVALELAFLAYVGLRNVTGFATRRAERVRMLVLVDFALHLALIVAGIVMFFSWSGLWDPVDLG
ncbi:MAG TPA: amino acid permease, partial [Solirubrobacteraceae bacterium]|nr:amino acid permease [Solirubrobacteraceae bacterium]